MEELPSNNQDNLPVSEEWEGNDTFNNSENNNDNYAESYNTADYANKLSEHLLGLKTNDPKIVERLIEDQNIIRAKYNLPPRKAISNLPEYERLLRNIAQSIGVSIKEKSECGKFFEENSVGGVHFENDNKIGVNINKNTKQSYTNSLNSLEHELIHALQHHFSPRMPIELMEYEAYIAGGNNEFLRESPEGVEVVFSDLIGASIRWWYSQESKNKGETNSPD